MSINRVSISGNLTRDAEMRSTASGLSVLNFSIAVNERRKNQQTGEWGDYPNFIDCTLFGARADGLQAYLTKGIKVAVDGKLHMSTWDDREDNTRHKLSVYVDEIDLMSRGQRVEQKRYEEPTFYSDDIPF